MIFRQLYDPETPIYIYVLADGQTCEAVLIDLVRKRIFTLPDETRLHPAHN